VVSFAAAALAALGTQTLLGSPATPRRTPLVAWGVVLGMGVLLALAGVWEGIMRGLAPAQHQANVTPAAQAMIRDTLRVLVLGGGAIGLIWQRLQGRFGGPRWALALGFLVLLDLWSVERHYIKFSPPPSALLGQDQLAGTLAADTGLFRVVPGANYLGLRGVRSVMGYSGTEIHRYDELLGRTGDERRNLYHPTVWRLLGVRYVMSSDTVRVPELLAVDSQPLRMMERPGASYLYRFRDAEPYAYLVPLALKVAEEQQTAVIVDARFDPRRYLIVPADAPVGATQVDKVPDPIATPARVTPRRAGAYTIELAAGAPEGSLLFFSENWHPGWRATVDGRAGQVLRAQHTLMGIPLAAGARRVELAFRDPNYPLGRLITLGVVVLLLGLWVQGWWSRRGRGEPVRA
jgi:hypothetical protein